MNSQKSLDLAGLAGKLLLENGAEIFRTQDTMHRILDCCGYPNHNIFVISNGIFATVNEGEEDHCNLVRHVPLGSVNLSKISVVNQIARELENGRYSPEEAFEQFNNIENSVKKESVGLLLFASGMGACAFCFMLGGKFIDLPFAFFLGFILQVFIFLFEKHLPNLLTTLCASFIATILSILFTYLFPGVHVESLVIGAIIILVPGVAFTTGIRELFNGDYLSGIIHLSNALLIGICIASGVALALGMVQALGGSFL
ncbi:MAG: threonine/serine exporter family protein [Bacillota bacterium]|nr:threonine/serine exporter family protein [Bacillota bacterium]